MRTILQSEAGECGLACLAMVADHYGHHAELVDFRKKFSVSLKGVSLESLIRHAVTLDLSARAVRVEIAGLRNLKLPCILHWNLDHFVVLKSVSTSIFGLAKYVLLDPAIGQRTLSEDQLSESFTGVILELIPTPAFKKVENLRKISLSDLTGRVAGLRRAVVQLIALACALELLAVLSPFLNQIVIDDIIVTGDLALLNLLLICFAWLLLTQMVIGLFRSWILLRWSAEVNVQWSTRILSHLIRLPIAFFERRHLGDVISRFGSINAIQSTLSSLFLESFLDIVMLLLACVLMFNYSLTLTLITLGSVFMYVLLRYMSYGLFFVANQERVLLAAREQSFFLETIRGISPVKLFGYEQRRVQGWQSLKSAVVDRDLRTQKLDIIFKACASTIVASKNLLILYFGARIVIDGNLSVGMLMAFLGYSALFSSRANSLADLWMKFRMLSLHMDRIADIVLENREETDSLPNLSTAIPNITLKNVKHRFAAGEPWVLDGVNLEICPADSLVLVGASGSGKTTLFKIIVGLITPTEGEVLIDGVPLRKYGVDNYRQLIGTVMQDDILLTGSISDNISFFSPYPDRAQIEECAIRASIHKEICQFPMGYETLVGDMGSVLSSGQKQRVMLARALYRAPKILALDEGSSHLDIGNEKKVNRALANSKITRIFVAHRPETIRSAGRVVLLKNGQTRELASDLIEAFSAEEQNA